jgi:hypothetical protein
MLATIVTPPAKPSSTTPQGGAPGNDFYVRRSIDVVSIDARKRRVWKKAPANAIGSDGKVVKHSSTGHGPGIYIVDAAKPSNRSMTG